MMISGPLEDYCGTIGGPMWHYWEITERDLGSLAVGEHKERLRCWGTVGGIFHCDTAGDHWGMFEDLWGMLGDCWKTPFYL